MSDRIRSATVAALLVLLVSGVSSCTRSDTPSCDGKDGASLDDLSAASVADLSGVDGAGNASLGTPGSLFAGTACSCDTPTAGKAGEALIQGGEYLLGSRTTTTEGCVINYYAGEPFAVLVRDGTVQLTNVTLSGMVLEKPSWTCDAGSFRIQANIVSFGGKNPYVAIVTPPACPDVPCPTGATCSPGTVSLCVVDGSLVKGVRCNETRNCQIGLSCVGNICS